MPVTSGALPKSKRGRKAVELNQSDLEAIVKILTDKPTTDNRPTAVGSDEVFTTKGRAGSMGRRYAEEVSKSLDGKTIRVNTYENGKGYSWRVYIAIGENGTADKKK